MYHPNIDLEGNVCLNILREDWKPVLTVTSIIYGLNFLFLVRDLRTSQSPPFYFFEDSMAQYDNIYHFLSIEAVSMTHYYYYWRVFN